MKLYGLLTTKKVVVLFKKPVGLASCPAFLISLGWNRLKCQDGWTKTAKTHRFITAKLKYVLWLGDLKASLSNFLKKLIYNASSSGKSVIGILPDGVNGRAVLHFIPVQKWKTWKMHRPSIGFFFTDANTKSWVTVKAFTTTAIFFQFSQSPQGSKTQWGGSTAGKKILIKYKCMSSNFLLFFG